ncbi:hypothetical protein O6H91_20G056100 [Diphasiastrum complanatum]|nr:hypothetical protein O6H91_20G056100 [Diphasiastrum complanatum]
MVEQEADDDSAIRHGCGSVEVGETSSCSASKALCMQNYARSQQDECMKESLQHPENVESSYSRPEYLQQRLYAGTASPLVRCPSQSDCNSAEQSGLRWAGYSAQFGAYNQGSAKPALCSPKYDHLPPETRISVGPSGNLKKISCVHGKPGIESNIVQFPQLGSNSFSKFPSGLEGTLCPSHELNEAAKDSRRFGQNCSSSSQLPMQGKADMTKDLPLANDCRPSQSDLFFKKGLNSKNVLSSGVGEYEGNLFGNCTTKPPEHGSKMRQADKKAPVEAEAKRSSVFSSGSIEMNQRHNSGVGRAGYHINEDGHRRISPDPVNLEGYVMNGLSMGMKERKAGFAKPQAFVEQLLGADRLMVEQGRDQAYVLTPIFAETHPFFQSEKKKSITTMLHKERPESVSVSTRNFKKSGQHSASAVPNHKSKESGQQQGLDFHLTPFTHSQRPLTQVTTDSVTASLPTEFVGDLYRGTCSLDPEQHFENSFPYKDELRAQSSSSPTREVK